MKFLLSTLLAASLLVGCAATPSRPLPPREQVSSFTLEARFALRIRLPGEAEQSSGGRLSWTQQDNRSRLLVSTPLGYGVAEIDSIPGRATLRTANGEIREADDPDTLMEAVTGQRLPVSYLPAWLLGRTGDASKIQRDLFGRPQHLEESGWQVDYSYETDAAEALPARLTLSRDGQIELRLRIEEWKDTP